MFALAGAGALGMAVLPKVAGAFPSSGSAMPSENNGRWQGPLRPRFQPVQNFPINLPPGKLLGPIVAVSASPVTGDIFLMHYMEAAKVLPAPEARVPWIVRLDKNGNFISAWGGPDQLPRIGGDSQWPVSPENVEVDAEGNVWIASYNVDGGDNAMVRFTPDGKFLSQFGQRNVRGDNASTQFLGAPPSAYHHVPNREVFIADGYTNNRIIAFDVDSGQFKRAWGSYGEDPTTQTKERSFGNPVHKINMAPDGRLLACDRAKHRVQEFEVTPTGVSFVREISILPGAAGYGTAADVLVTPDNKWMYVLDMSYGRVWLIDRQRWEVVGWVNGENAESYQDQDPTLYDAPRFASPPPIHRFTMLPSGDLLLARTRIGLGVLKLDAIR